MIILAFETSCDDTSVAIFRDTEILSMVTHSQIAEHTKTGGVVPEVAARLHANNALDVLRETMEKSWIPLSQVDIIACTSGPGLVTSLLVGKTVAKTLSHALGKPILWIDHIEAHMFANFIERDFEDISFPNVCLTVSGGHNEIYLWKSLFERELLGETTDDAAGEAFDKVAKAMGLGFPGGPIVSKLASEYRGEYRGIFPIVLLEKNSLDFSFSGLKTAVKREIDQRVAVNGALTENDRQEISFEFERTVAEILTRKILLAASVTGARHLVLSGGVSANDFLRATITERAQELGYTFTAPISKIYSQDNAAMVGILAYYRAVAWKATKN